MMRSGPVIIQDVTRFRTGSGIAHNATDLSELGRCLLGKRHPQG